MRVTLHFEKTMSGEKGHRMGKRQKKMRSLSVKTGPDLANKTQPRKTCTSAYTETCSLMGLMWALGWLGEERGQQTETGAKKEGDLNQLQNWSLEK